MRSLRFPACSLPCWVCEGGVFFFTRSARKDAATRCPLPMNPETRRPLPQLPIRYADFGVLHRNELSGTLTGLTRVRRFQQAGFDGSLDSALRGSKFLPGARRVRRTPSHPRGGGGSIGTPLWEGAQTLGGGRRGGGLPSPSDFSRVGRRGWDGEGVRDPPGYGGSRPPYPHPRSAHTSLGVVPSHPPSGGGGGLPPSSHRTLPAGRRPHLRPHGPDHHRDPRLPRLHGGRPPDTASFAASVTL